MIQAQELKQSSQLRLLKEQKEELRRRNLIVLIVDHLKTFNFHEAAKILESSSGLHNNSYQVADNICLLDILQEFETFHEIKHNKAPKLVKKLINEDIQKSKPKEQASTKKKLVSINMIKNSSEPNSKRSSFTTQKEHEDSGLDIRGFTALSHSMQPKEGFDELKQASAEILEGGEKVLLRPLALPSSGGGDRAELVQIIQRCAYIRDILVTNLSVSWDQIAGLDGPKRLLKEAITFPLRYPELFTGIVQPWNGILLYGLPGCGKTMLAKAVATEGKTTFFNISASTIVSKWRGESEKLVRVLFEMARHYAPSTIFIDELDSIMSSRAADGEHEGSRRMKTEILIQMDGLSRTEDERVFVLGASNLPWELDTAMIRRLEKRIHIGLPDTEAIVSILENRLPKDQTDGFGNQVVNPQVDYKSVSKHLLGYSGSDIASICKEAAMIPLRSIFYNIETSQLKEIKREMISQDHILMAKEKIKSSCNVTMLAKYQEWENDFGSS